VTARIRKHPIHSYGNVYSTPMIADEAHRSNNYLTRAVELMRLGLRVGTLSSALDVSNRGLLNRTAATVGLQYG
jgi:hypothetical protein